MSILLNDNLNISASKPVDIRYGPYDSTAAALAAIPSFQRYRGLVVGITNGSLVEYWFKDGILDSDLEEKTSGGISGEGYTGSQGELGFTGSQGELGFTGSKGYSGSEGYTGSQGELGFTGSQGELGFTGSIGFTGSQGDIGYTGSQGDIGYTGSKGTDGTSVKIIGSTSTYAALPGSYAGDIGDGYITADNGHLNIWVGSTWSDVGNIVGPQGELGYTGSIGFTGSRGIDGYTGSQGELGYVGSQGEVGYVGSQGDQGDTGYIGSQGDIGYVGSQGELGYVGSQGQRGDTGYAGSQGEVGYVGSQGDVGYTGSKGDRGDSGYVGSQGNVGYTGSQGIEGYTGSAGQDGIIGVDGYTGSQGYTGSAGPGADQELNTTSSVTFANITLGADGVITFADGSVQRSKSPQMYTNADAALGLTIDDLLPGDFYYDDSTESIFIMVDTGLGYNTLLDLTVRAA